MGAKYCDGRFCNLCLSVRPWPITRPHIKSMQPILLCMLPMAVARATMQYAMHVWFSGRRQACLSTGAGDDLCSSDSPGAAPERRPTSTIGLVQYSYPQLTASWSTCGRHQAQRYSNQTRRVWSNCSQTKTHMHIKSRWATRLRDMKYNEKYTVNTVWDIIKVT